MRKEQCLFPPNDDDVGMGVTQWRTGLIVGAMHRSRGRRFWPLSFSYPWLPIVPLSALLWRACPQPCVAESCARQFFLCLHERMTAHALNCTADSVLNIAHKR